ncbi:MAG TPA: carboxypeptidase regulatory-like domain-containing protein [Conexibacter sp.]|nr:carboxypeptidase regulatory-like domain-containing protein [Conexibacter sp.]
MTRSRPRHTSRTPRRALFAALAALLLAPGPAALAGDWTVAEIAGPPGTRWIQPNAVNANGVVVGRAWFPGRTAMTAFRWEDGTMIELDSGGAQQSNAYDINDSGTIVGNTFDGVASNGAVWTATRTTSTFSPTAFNISGRYGSSAFGINEAGTIAGTAGDTGTIPPPWNDGRSRYENSFPALTSGGGWSRLQMPDISTDRGAQVFGGDAVQINDNGLIMIGGANMGSRPRLSSGGVASDLYDIVPGNQGFNDLGQMAGRTTGDPNNEPFSARVWNGSGYDNVGAAQPRSRANAINNLGWVVGRAGTEDWQAEYRQVGNAWLWRPDAPPTPLLELGPTGWSYANALDVNDDGVIVGVGRHGSKEVGFMLTPASIAHRLSGKVWKIDGQPAAGAQLRIVNAAGQEVAPPVTTGGDGRYETTLPRGDYRVTVLPDGVYMPDAGAGCTIVAFTCALGLRQNRVVDFYGVPTGPIVVPRPPTGDRARDTTRPVFRGPRANTAVAASRGGVVGVKLGPFSEDASGTVALQQPGTTARPRGRARGGGRSRARAVASAAAVALGSRSFRVGAGRSVVVAVTLNRRAQRLLRQRRSIRAVAVVTARDAAGNATVTRFALTLKAARASARRTRRGRRGR